MKEIYIESKYGNNLLRKLREARGLSKSGLARESGVFATIVGGLENFKISPRRRKCIGNPRDPTIDKGDDGWRKSVIVLSNYFSVEPEDIFPESTWYLKGEKPVIREISVGEVIALTGESTLRQLLSPEQLLDEKDRHNIIDQALSNLTPREERVLRMRFGIGYGGEAMSDHTYEEVGQDFEVTRERIRQIEAKALRKLRNPKIKEIRQYYEP